MADDGLFEYDLTSDYDIEAYERTELPSTPNKTLRFKRQYGSSERQNIITKKRKLMQKTEALAQRCTQLGISIGQAFNENLEITEAIKTDAILLQRHTNDKIVQKVTSAAIDAQRVRDQFPETFQLFKKMTAEEVATIPELRKGVKGVPNVPFKYHEIKNNQGDGRSLIDPPPKQYVKTGSEALYKVDKGPPVHPQIKQALRTSVGNMFDHIMKDYCRPTTTTDAVVMDFLTPQKEYKPFSFDRCSDVLWIIYREMHCPPYQPIHHRDFPFLGFPQNTGAGYFVRYKDALRRMSKYTHSAEYKRPTCKGFNATTLKLIAEKNFDTLWKNGTLSRPELNWELEIRLAMDFLSRPAIMFARSHVSKIQESLKIRSVIGIDDMFLFEEMMLSFAFLVLQRTADSCLAYGYETFRGGCKQLARISKRYGSVISIDWSSFDHDISWHFAEIFFEKFLPSMIVINKGWQASILTHNSPEDLDPDIMYKRCRQTLNHLHSWFRNLVFVSTDGYAYRRSFCGVPSGLMNTQILDSFCNLCLIIDALLECSTFTKEEILDLFICVQGDDVLIYCKYPDTWASEFLLAATVYCINRWGSTINPKKSKYSRNTYGIDFLGYEIGEGHPTRPIEKLVAQLMWPERRFNPANQASRAVGVAIANTGSNQYVHGFCEAIFERFHDQHKFTPFTKTSFRKKIDPSESGIFKHLEENLTFPNYFELALSFRSWRGPLTYEPRWPTNHFLGVNPDHLKHDDSVITMEDYERNNDIEAPEPPPLINYDNIKFQNDHDDSFY